MKYIIIVVQICKSKNVCEVTTFQRLCKDIVKAFDTVRWKFLFVCLQSYNIRFVGWKLVCALSRSILHLMVLHTGSLKGRGVLGKGIPSPLTYLFW